MAKVYASEAYNELADEALQVFGGYGFSEEYPPARMYRDSRITRIYEGTNEICRLYAQRAMLRRSWSGTLDFDDAIEALAHAQATAVDGTTSEFDALRFSIQGFKHIYFYLVREVSSSIERDRMFDADNQQFMASLADVAIDIFAVESTFLRVAKQKCDGAGRDTAFPEALARICFERASGRIRNEANEILAALYEGTELRSRLEDVATWLPLPTWLIKTRAFVARSVLDRGGLPAPY